MRSDDLHHTKGNVSEENKAYIQLVYFTFRGPCIVIYSYNESQRDALFLKFI